MCYITFWRNRIFKNTSNIIFHIESFNFNIPSFVVTNTYFCSSYTFNLIITEKPKTQAADKVKKWKQ